MEKSSGNSRSSIAQKVYLWHMFVGPEPETLLNFTKIWWVKKHQDSPHHSGVHRGLTTREYQSLCNKYKCCVQKPNLLLFWYLGSLNAIAHSRCAFQTVPVLNVCLAWPNMESFIPSRNVFICSHQKMYTYGGNFGCCMPTHQLRVCRVKRYCQAAYVSDI